MASITKLTIRSKKFPVGDVQLRLTDDGFPIGLKLRRELTTTECRYIMKAIFGCRLLERNDYSNIQSAIQFFKEYNDKLTTAVNEWLRGREPSMEFIERFSVDYNEKALTPFSIIPILAYLKSKEII